MHLRKAEELARKSPRKDAMQRFIPEKIRLWLFLGNLSAAARWAEEQESITRLTDAEQIARSRVWLVKGESTPLEKARQLLAELELRAAAQGQTGRQIESLLLKSLALHAQKQDQLAVADLEKCVRLAEPEGYARIFLNEGQPMFELLGMVLKRGVAHDYVRGLIDAFTLRRKGQAPQPLVEPLTGRELEVLGLLAGGYTNSEIAERLVIAAGTVKRHTLSIYQKLGVNSRTQAIARARDLNLLS
jgi:LuxR family maltose regulon positive regulatory protein